MQKVLFFFFLYLISISIQGQVGKEFWFVAPDVTVGHGDEPIMFRITALDRAAQVTVSMPANNAYTPVTIDIPAFTQTNFVLDKDVVENSPSNKINDKGILVSSDVDVVVYYEVANGVNPDKFTLKGQNGLGLEFFVPSQNLYRNRSLKPIADEKVDIVATEDNTQVTIIPTADIVGHKAHISFTITLNKGQTYCLENTNDHTASSSLAGTYLLADKFIAVTISDDSIWEEYNLYGKPAGPYDLIGDQLIPTRIIGTEYIGINTSTDARTINKVFVLATQDNTYITINNDPTLIKGPYNKGEQVNFDITDNAIFISATHPIYAYQLASFWNRTGNEIGSAVLPSVSCTGSQTVSFVRSFNKKFYAQLMTQEKNIRSFVFKDQAGAELKDLEDVILDQEGNSYTDLNSIPWTKVKGTDGGDANDTWYTAVISLKITTSIPYTIANTNGLFHMSILDENQGSTSYGYFSSYGQLRLEGPSQECQGNVIVLRTAEPMKSYNWFSEHSGNTVISTAPTLDVTESGKYWVTAEVNFGGCLLTDSLEVEFLLPQFDLGPDEIICPDQTLQIAVEDGLGEYVWSDGSTSNEIELTLDGDQRKTVSLTVTDGFNCSNTDTKEVSSYPLPMIDLSKKEVCEGEKIVNLTPLEKYEWRFEGKRLNADDTQNFIIPQQSGQYTLTAWAASGCEVTDRFELTVRALPNFDIPDQLGCVAATTTVHAPVGDGYTYVWSDGSTLNHIELNAPADLSLQITDGYGCVAEDDFNFDYLPAAPFNLGNDREECAGITLTIDQGSDYTHFEWKFQANGSGVINDLPLPTPEHAYEINPATPAHSGKYYVSALDKNGCAVADIVDVEFVKANPPVLAIDQNLCSGEEITISASTGYDTYNWYIDGVHQPALNTNSITVSDPGLYSVEASIGGCTKTNDITVAEHANPTIQLKGVSDICEKGSGVIQVDQFTAGGLSSFDYLVWNDEERQFKDWETAQLVVQSAGVFTVTAYDNMGCKATDDITIGEYPKTILDLGPPQQTCEDIALTLVNPINTSLKYEWYKVDALVDTRESEDADIMVAASGSYRLRMDDVNGCEVSDTVVVKVLPVPTVDLGADREMCVGDELVLESDKVYEAYRWNDDPTLKSASMVVAGAMAGVNTYKLEVKNIHGCWAQDMVQITAHPSPVFSFSDQAVCAGEEVVLSAPANLSHFKWSTGEETASITVLNGRYTLEAANHEGCVGKATALVKWHDAPKVDIGEDEFICPVDNMELVATDGFEYYEWHNGSNEKSIRANFADTVNFVKVRDANNCWGFDSKIVKPLPAPAYELNPDAVVCSGDTLILNAGDDYLAYHWSDDTTHPTLTVRESGEYWVKVLDGCFWLHDTTTIVFNEAPVIARLDTTVYGQVAIFPEGGSQPYKYAINDEGWQDENVFKNLESGVYVLQVEDVNSCVALDTITFSSLIDIDIPNFFTPNNDGFNDRWELEGMDKLPNSIIRIYDRYGKLLIRYRASEPGWNGMYLGRPVPSDAYWYVIEVLPTNKFLKGHITLKR